MNQKKHNHKITDHNTELENRILNYILLFMTCAFLGWIWEVMLHLIQCFGLCALAIIYYLYPLLTRVYNYLKLRPKKILCFALTLFFLADFVYSSDCPNIGEGITDNLSYYSNYKSEEIT